MVLDLVVCLVLCLVLCNLIISSFDDRKLIIQRDRKTDTHTKHAQPHRHKPGVSLRWVAEVEMKYKPVPKRILNKDIMNGDDLPQTNEPSTKKHKNKDIMKSDDVPQTNEPPTRKRTNKDIMNGDDLPSATRMSSAAMTLHQHQMVVDDDGGRNTRQRERETQQECREKRRHSKSVKNIMRGWVPPRVGNWRVGGGR